jgi:hypothetical protein
MHQLDISGVIQRSINVWTKNALPFILIALVVNLPSFVVNAMDSILEIQGRGGGLSTLSLVRFVVTLFVVIFSVVAQYIVSGMICYSVFRTIKGEAPSMQESLSMAVRNLLPIFVLSLLQGFAIFMGTLACIFPGIILSLMFYVAMPALVVERLGPVEALKRSQFLTEGHKVYILALMLIVSIASGTISAMLVGCTSLVLIGGAAAANGGKAIIYTMMVVIQIPAWIILAIASTFGATLMTSVYHDLRQMRDGVSVDDLLSVFD